MTQASTKSKGTGAVLQIIFRVIYGALVFASFVLIGVGWGATLAAGQIAWGGDEIATNYHTSAPDQRWACDIVVEPAFYNKKRLDAYGCFA